jgi:hypothetical protein
MAHKVTVNIKMYKVGELGDCFFLQFTADEARSNVLLDFGSFRNGKKSIQRMNDIADNIIGEQLKGESLNVVIGTHQHNDHLSGFVHAKEKLRTCNIDQVWLSWLDDPEDQQANRIGTEYNNFIDNLWQISQRLSKVRSSTAIQIKKRMDRVLGFYGFTPKNDSFNARKKTKTPPSIPAEAIRILKKIGNKKPAYLNPGDVLNLPGLPAGHVKVYVLGPPKNEKLLKDPNPNSTETYDHELAISNTQAKKMLIALDILTNHNGRDDEQQPYPFNEPNSNSPNFAGVWKSYYSRKNVWRTIDNDWLKQAERLALWIDSYTNNSSLVLAFELVNSGKVLLFVGDAQTGNWNSWKLIKWKKKPPNFNWKTLLQKTVLYKVGHHCSHNATLVEGLEEMIHEELVALIPVDETDANITKETDPWNMPATNLYERLKQKTRNRILRMDKGIVDNNKVEVKSAWKELGLNPKNQELFVELTIQG